MDFLHFLTEENQEEEPRPDGIVKDIGVVTPL
jgi:hypothetical protein